MTNGDPDGGLYNCADITLSSTAAAVSSSVCKNATAVTVSAAQVTGNPNETTSSSSSSSANSGAVVGKSVVSLAGLLGVVGAAVVFGAAL